MDCPCSSLAARSMKPDTSLPLWLEELRHAEIQATVERDPRSWSGHPLGVDQDTVFREVCGRGQADFDKPWNDLSPDDRVLLYARSFQRGHLQELLAAFRMLFRDSAPESSVVIDLGCGPFTGGLAMAAALDSPCQFDYIGVDRSFGMRRLGKRLADSVADYHRDAAISHRWAAGISDSEWSEPLSWRSVFVIVSFLLASPSLDPVTLIHDLNYLLQRIGRGDVTVLYTNSLSPRANERYPEFRDALADLAIEAKVQGDTTLPADRDSGYPYERRLRYALFHRPRQTEFNLD